MANGVNEIDKSLLYEPAKALLVVQLSVEIKKKAGWVGRE